MSNYFNIIIRPHPKDQDLHKEKFQLFKKSKIKLDLMNGRDTSDLILSSDFIISDGGSSIVEAIYLKKKVVIHNWQILVDKKDLESRFTENQRLDNIVALKLLRFTNLENISKIIKKINSTAYRNKINALHKNIFFKKK